MSDENETQNDEETTETAAKPTITIAELDKSDEEEGETNVAKPTITIAEREGGE